MDAENTDAEKIAAAIEPRLREILIGVDGTLALMLCAQLQVALRHPLNAGAAADSARSFIDHCIDVFEQENLPDVADLLRLGNDLNADTETKVN